jgi:HSP20 family molecular chaperone IbpA
LNRFQKPFLKFLYQQKVMFRNSIRRVLRTVPRRASVRSFGFDLLPSSMFPQTSLFHRSALPFPRPMFSMPDATFLQTPVSINESDDAISIKVEVPGVKREDIQVELNSNMLTVKGKKERVSKSEKTHEGEFEYEERSFGSFSRSFQVPESTKPDDIKAAFNDGILSVCVKKQKVQANQIQIEGKEGEKQVNVKEGHPEKQDQGGQGQQTQAQSHEGRTG